MCICSIIWLSVLYYKCKVWIWYTFIQYISDYNEISYDNWTIIDSIDGLVFSDGEILTSSVTEVLKLIEKNGSVNKYDIYSCRIWIN